MNKIIKPASLWLAAILLIVLSACTSAPPVNYTGASINKKKPGNPDTIAVYGDTQHGAAVHQEIIKLMSSFNPVAVFHTGDLVQRGYEPGQWQEFNEITEDFRTKTSFYPTLGNHEYNSKLYFENFQLPNNERWYSVDIANLHFAVLDSNWHIFKGSPQYQWLENDLKSAPANTLFKIAIFHHPPFTSGRHPQDEKKLKDSILPLLEKYKVDIVFNGHNHMYERLYRNGIYYIVTGGGGGPLYHIERNAQYSQVLALKHHFCILYPGNSELIIKVYDLSMKLIDSLKLEK